jgi:hypothetical protein
MATYSELVTMVRDWANRDSSVLPDGVIQSALRYSADEAYRLLEIPPLEFTKNFVVRKDTSITYCVYTSEGVYTEAVSNNIKDAILDDNDVNPNVNNASFNVPHDTISFIYLRSSGVIARPEIGATVSGVTVTENNQSNYAIINVNDTPSVSSHSQFTNTIFNEKMDVRAFYDFNDSEPYRNYFTRKGSKIICAGDIKEGDVLELFYYRRLPALDARPTLPSDLTLAQAQADTDTYEVITSQAWSELSYLEQRTFDELEGSYVRNKNEVSNWLKDQNERVVLFGALHRVFDYLQEDQQAEKYKARFAQSITELNSEEKRRKMSAGSAYVRYSANGLI